MATIIISDLQEKQFLYELHLEQMQKVSGASIIPLWGQRASNIVLTTVYDGINNLETAYRGPFGFYDNKFFTLDFARSNYYFIL
jgi:hypothetical protein